MKIFRDDTKGDFVVKAELPGIDPKGIGKWGEDCIFTEKILYFLLFLMISALYDEG